MRLFITAIIIIIIIAKRSILKLNEFDFARNYSTLRPVKNYTQRSFYIELFYRYFCLTINVVRSTVVSS